MNSLHIDSTLYYSAQILWDYMHVHHALEKADLIITLGNHDTNCARRAAELYFENYALLLLFSGGLGRHTANAFAKSEAEVFADIAVEMGVPKEKIILESMSTNTGENIRFSKEVLTNLGIRVRSIILVQKPYMERRTMATFEKQWPGIKFFVTSQQISFEEYCTFLSPEKVINIMVGDLQRIIEYPAKGFQTDQEVPENVLVAYETLQRLGYTKDMLQ